MTLTIKKTRKGEYNSMAQSFIKKSGSVMPHGVCKGAQAPAPKTQIRKEVSSKKTGIVKK